MCVIKCGWSVRVVHQSSGYVVALIPCKSHPHHRHKKTMSHLFTLVSPNSSLRFPHSQYLNLENIQNPLASKIGVLSWKFLLFIEKKTWVSGCKLKKIMFFVEWDRVYQYLLFWGKNQVPTYISPTGKNTEKMTGNGKCPISFQMLKLQRCVVCLQSFLPEEKQTFSYSKDGFLSSL